MKKSAQQKLTEFLVTLSPDELDLLDVDQVLRVRKAVRRHADQLSAYRIELAESTRIVEDATKRIADQEKTIARFKRSGDIESIMSAQAELKRLRRRLRSHTQAIPSIQAMIQKLEAEGPGVPISATGRPTRPERPARPEDDGPGSSGSPGPLRDPEEMFP